MNFLAALLASVPFLAVAAANPVNAINARQSSVRSLPPPPTSSGRHCDILPFLRCDGGIDQQIACGDVWTCLGNGLPPIIANATCAKECVCDVPCP
ncbi:hypothetical protein B0H11DRAFT_2224924 [Mycena galericulata]|nr:hypothetical protein B0H11DRAFT_2224924 [Mycena galericulata]